MLLRRVDRPDRLRVAARQVVGGPVALDRDRYPDRHRCLAVAHRVEVDRIREGVGAVGDAPELLAQQGLGVAHQLLHLGEEQFGAVLVDHRLEASLPRPAGGDLGEHVALCRLRHADVPQDEAQHLVVELPLPDEVDGRDVERLAVGRGRLGVEAPGDRPAGVRPVSGVLDEREQLAVAEDRHDRAHVLAVRSADEGVVHDEDVALVDRLLADPRDHALDGVRKCPHVRREVFLPFRHHSSVGVADGGAEVASLAHDEGVAYALEHQAHLVDDAHEGVAEHLERHRVDPFRPGDRGLAHRAPSRAITMFPTASTWAAVPGGSTTVLSSSSTTHGPGQLVSGRERFRRMRVATQPCSSKCTSRCAREPALGSAPVPHGRELALLAQASRRHPERRGLDRALGMGIAVLARCAPRGMRRPLRRTPPPSGRRSKPSPRGAGRCSGGRRALDDDRAGLDALPPPAA